MTSPPDTTDDHDTEQLLVGVPWELFLQWFASVWKQGQHVAIVGPTGCGKTTCAVGLTRLRKWVLALDAKGGDDTLAGSGYTPVADWPPPRRIVKDISEGRPARLVVGFTPKTLKDRPKLRDFLARVLDGAWLDGGWTLEIDELQIMADHKMMGLGASVEEFLIAARNKKVSVLTLFQAPAWVPTASTRQATWIILYPTRDETVIKSLAAKIGRPWQELKAILHALPDHHIVVVGLNPRDPYVLTKPEFVA
jgi:energy-coupling factor transporter ATP-binding protein EcfA2